MTASWAKSPSVRIDLDTQKWWHHEKTVEYLLFIRYDQKCPPTRADILRFLPSVTVIFHIRNKEEHINDESRDVVQIFTGPRNIYFCQHVCEGQWFMHCRRLSVSSRWCIKKPSWRSAPWPSTRRGRRWSTSPCPLWRRASASWCLVATGPSPLLPSSVNPSLLCLPQL